MTIETLNDIPSVRKYLERIGATARSLKVAIVKEEQGAYWNEVAKIKFSKSGEIEATLGYGPTEDEQSLIKAEFADAKWPKNVFPTSLENLPSVLKDADPENLFIFWDQQKKHILMLQSRVETPKGKNYIPWSYFDDNKWRPCEPDMENGLLPLWGLHTLKDQTTAFCSEGAKTGRFVERVINPTTPEEKRISEEFPWTEQFKHAASVAFVGGALNPARTDWSTLKKAGIQRLIILCDNDYYGVDAVTKIADLVDMPCFAVKVSDEFGPSWDVADPFSKSMYREINGKQYYVGPSYFDCLSPATMMTRKTSYIDDKGKEKFNIKLRHHAKNQWSFVEGQDVFVNNEFPQFQWNQESLDKYLAPFSHAKKTSELLLQEYSCRINKLAYRPDVNKRRVMTDGEMSLNLFRPSNLGPQEGDPKPFLDFIHYLVPDEQEAKLVLRWIATLVARPDIRMLYGLLLISEMTGVGKTLLAESILAPLVGLHNTSFPSESTIMEPYTDWIARKRLCVIGEIYQGHSFKMANKLKSFVTDNKISYRTMYMKAVTIDNFAHFVACSNSMAALRLDAADRRWMVPKLAEERLPDEKYDELVEWLQSGGLNIIRHWADNFTDYVKRGEKAPMTNSKREIIESGRSKASVRCEELSALANSEKTPVAFTDQAIREWLEAITKEKVFESLLAIRRLMKQYGMAEGKEIGIDRISYSSQMSNVILNQAALDKLSLIADINERKEVVRSFVKRPSELMQFE